MSSDAVSNNPHLSAAQAELPATRTVNIPIKSLNTVTPPPNLIYREHGMLWRYDRMAA
jgi:hypothetical protein